MIDCKLFVENRKAYLKAKTKGKSIRLVIVQVGDNQASNRYVNGKINDCKDLNIESVLYKLEEDVTTSELVSLITELNNDSSINGIIVQLPLPKHIIELDVINAIAIEKDVDGFKNKSPYTPCTPKGVLTLLEHLQVDLRGKNVVLVGYGKLVNKPLMSILSNMGSTITICRSHTSKDNLRQFCKMADIIITAVGTYGLIDESCIDKNHAPILIDCGISIINGKQYGDCDVSLYDCVDNITNRVNAMGLMTRISLMENVIEAYDKQHERN